LWDDLSTIVLLDDRHTSAYPGQEDNLIQISRWNGEQDDTALRDMIPILADLVLSDDFPMFLKHRKETLRKSSTGSIDTALDSPKYNAG
jgi:TFIIF-interacting CTD phosphatase-like protein